MIKTFKVGNTAVMQTSLVEVQPQASTTAAPSGNQASLPPSEAKIKGLAYTSQQNGQSSLSTNASLKDIVNAISLPGFSTSTFRGQGTNRYIPSQHNRHDPNHNLPKSTDDLAVSPQKFEPYEQLTGISKERPEVIMMTNFVPLYKSPSSTNNNDKEKYSTRSASAAHNATPAGHFFDTQCTARALRQANFNHIWSTLKETYPGFKHTASGKFNIMGEKVNQLSATAFYLYNLVKTLELLKRQLDIRDDVHIVEAQKVSDSHDNKNAFQGSSGGLSANNIASAVPPKYDTSYVMGLFGYNTNSVKGIYSSTKIWMQLLLELKHVLRSHSLDMLDIPKTIQKNDSSATRIVKTPNTKRFEYASLLPANLPTLSVLKDLQPASLPKTIQAITDAYDSMYTGVHFKNEEMRIAGIFNMMSREYRYSRGLTDDDVKQALSNYYGFTATVPSGAPKENNAIVLDAIIGQFGNNISDVASATSNSLASLAQQQPSADVVVLPLESRYIDGDDGTLTPGSVYYVDQVLSIKDNRFDTKRLEVLRTTIREARKAFGIIVSGMNFLSKDDQVDDGGPTISNPRTFFDQMRATVLDSAGYPIFELKYDPLVPVFAAAHKNKKIRSLLLMYTVTVISRAYLSNISYLNSLAEQDNTATTEAIVNSLIKELQIDAHHTATSTKTASKAKYDPNNKTTLAQSGSPPAPAGSIINVDTIKNALKQEPFGRFIGQVITMMSRVMQFFRIDSQAASSGFTRYGGHVDTIVLMTMLDIFTSMIYNWGGRRITGIHSEKSSSPHFTIDEHVDNHTPSINEIDSRLAKEINHTHTVIFAIFNLLDNLANSIDNVIHAVNGPDSLTELKKITDLIDDPVLLQLLFSEQQISLFASAVADIQSALKGGTFPKEVGTQGTFDSDEEIRALDDSVVSSKMKDVLETVLSLPEYSSKFAAAKKILTVGIPLGFARHLQQKLTVHPGSNSTSQRSGPSKGNPLLKKDHSFDVRQNDVIEIAVHKVDLQNPDIIFRPVKFLFELTRYPVRNDGVIGDEAEASSSRGLQGIVNGFATRGYAQVFAEGGDAVQFFKSHSAYSQALSGPLYSFLTDEQKQQLYTNHVMSYLFEVYLRVMTGVSTTDYHFDLVQAPPPVDVKNTVDVVKHYLNFLQEKTRGGQRTSRTTGHSHTHSDPSGGMYMSQIQINPGFLVGTNSTSPGNIPRGMSQNPWDFSVADMPVSDQTIVNTSISKANGNLPSSDEVMSSFSSKQVAPAVHGVGVISEGSRTLSPQSDPVPLTKRLLNPKQFDRVFNIVIDPFAFKINKTATNASPHGKQALELLLKQGDVIHVLKQTSSPSHVPFFDNEFAMRPRDVSEGNLSFEKYIVSINTIGEEEV